MSDRPDFICRSGPKRNDETARQLHVDRPARKPCPRRTKRDHATGSLPLKGGGQEGVGGAALRSVNSRRTNVSPLARWPEQTEALMLELYALGVPANQLGANR